MAEKKKDQRQKQKEESSDQKEQEVAAVSFSDLIFDVTREEMEAVKKVYSSQCPGLAHKEEQRDLWKTLAIARKNHIPLLPWVIDSFTRDRFQFYLRKQQTLNLQQWVSDFPTLKSLSKHKKHHDTIQAAVQTFFHRYTAPFSLPVLERTDDSIEDFTTHITEAISFIHTCLDGDMVNPPFQVDVMIIPKKVVDMSNEEDDSDDDDDDDFDDEDESSDSDSESKQDGGGGAFGQIPDIKQRLEMDKERIFVHRVLPNGLRPRSYHEVHRELKLKLIEAQKGKGKCQAASSRNPKDGFKDEMPNRRRICFVADRRKEAEQLFVFKGMDGTGDLPPNQVHEWYYQSSFRSLIPGTHKNNSITAKTSAKGYVFVLSFQVPSRDCIKAYLYTRSQMIRFLPQDVATLLPELFVASERNKKFVQEWRAKEESNKAKLKLVDPQYDRFRSHARSTQKRKGQ